MTLAALLVSVGVGALGAPEAPVPAPVPIEGTVVDADRRPAGGVGVFLSDFKGRSDHGEIVGQVETDAQGRFRLEVPAAPDGGPEPGILWAYRPGSLVASYPVDRDTVPPDWPISMVIDAPARAQVIVRGPDGGPVAGARIQPVALHGPPYNVPEGLAERIAVHTITDARGRAVLTAFFPEEVNIVTVSAPGLGRQRFTFESFPGSRRPRAIELSPVGRVEGRIVADDPALVRNRKLLAGVSDSRRGQSAIGLEYLMTDEQGRFTILEAPVGRLSISGNPLPGSPWFLQSVTGDSVEAGRPTRVEVKPIAGVRLRGTVREQFTGIPVVGAAVHVYRTDRDDDAAVRTDAAGRFTLFAPAGYRPQILVSAPDGHAPSTVAPNMPRVLRGVDAFDLPPISLSRARTVVGVVVDDRGEPVPGARALASYYPVGQLAAWGYPDRRAVTGRRGEFQIHGVVDAAPVNLSAIAPDGRRTVQSFESRPGAGPVRLVVASASGGVSLAGRVVDTAGRRVAGARVHIRVQEHDPNGHFKADRLVEIRGAYTIRTRDDGWFRTPPVLEPRGPYSALVEADGYELARTIWTEGKARMFPEVVLRPRAELAGTVVDRAGRPVAGAALRMIDDSGEVIPATADAQGRFRLEGDPTRPTFLFVKAPGFRFFGRVFDPAAGPISIVPERAMSGVHEQGTPHPVPLPAAAGRGRTAGGFAERTPPGGADHLPLLPGRRGEGARRADEGPDADPSIPCATHLRIALTCADERPTTAMTTTTALPAAEERTLARRAFLPYAARVVKGDNGLTRFRTLRALARVAPELVLEALNDHEDSAGDSIRWDCALARLREGRREDAIAIIEAMKDPETRAHAYLDTVGFLPASDRAAGRELIDQALRATRGIAEAQRRVYMLGQVAEHDLDLGEIEAGTKLLRETLPAARALPLKGFAGHLRAIFAAELAQVDPDAALALIEGVGEVDRPDGYRLYIARELAARDPARAESLLAALNGPDRLARNLPALCHAMAQKDPDRARRLADRDLGHGPIAREQPFARPYAIGLIALVLADTDKPRATHLLDEAFTALEPLAAEGRRGSNDPQDAASVAAALLPVAERIDPALVPEFFWRAVALRTPSNPQTPAPARPDTMLALLLARYDRDAALALIRPILARGPTVEDVRDTFLIRALTVIDPARAAALVDALPDDPDLDLNPRKNVKNNARLDLVTMLGNPPPERWDQWVVRRLLHLWIVGDENEF